MKGCGVMPKEQITFARVQEGVTGSTDPDVPTVTLTRIDPEIRIVWNRESYVQLEFEADVSFFDSLAKSENGPDVSRISAYTPSLTREEINRFIRVLRRARDAAYGKDE